MTTAEVKGRFITRYDFWSPETWAIPKLYWDAFSQEQRIHAICRQLGKVIAYADYLGVNVDDVAGRLQDIEDGKLDDFIVAAIEEWFEENEPEIQQAIEQLQTDVEQLKTDVDTAESDIEQLQTNVSTVTQDLATEIATREETTNLVNSDNWVTLDKLDKETIYPVMSPKYMAPFKRVIPNGTNLKSTGFMQDVIMFEQSGILYMMLGFANNDESVHVEIIQVNNMSVIYSNDTSILYHTICGFEKDGSIYSFNNNTKTLVKIDLTNVASPTYSIVAVMPNTNPAYLYDTYVMLDNGNDELILSDGVLNFVVSFDTLAYIRTATSFNQDDVFYVNGACADDTYFYVMCNYPNTIIVIDKETFETVYKIPIAQKTLFYAYGEAQSLSIHNGVLYTCGETTYSGNIKMANIVKFDINKGEPFFQYPTWETWINATVYVDNSVDLNAEITGLVGTAAHPFKFIEDVALCSPSNMNLKVVFVGEYPYVFEVPSVVETIIGDANTLIRGIQINQYRTVKIAGSPVIQRGVSLFGTWATAIRCYNGGVELNEGVSFESYFDTIDDANQFNVYLAASSKLVSWQNSLTRVWGEIGSLVICSHLLPPYVIRGKANVGQFTYDSSSNSNILADARCSVVGLFRVGTSTSDGAFLMQKGTTYHLPVTTVQLNCTMADGTETNDFTIQLNSFKNSTTAVTAHYQLSAITELTFTIVKRTIGNYNTHCLDFTVTSMKKNGTEGSWNIYATGLSN